MSLYVCLIPVSYLVFIFIAESLNPFVEPNSRLRRRHWRLGRVAGAATLGFGYVALTSLNYLQVNPKIVLIVFLVCVLLSIFPSLLQYKRANIV